jgi:hypothetical protein
MGWNGVGMMGRMGPHGDGPTGPRTPATKSHLPGNARWPENTRLLTRASSKGAFCVLRQGEGNEEAGPGV